MRPFFADRHRQKALFIPGCVRTGFHNLFCSVCCVVYVCFFWHHHWLRELYQVDIHKPEICRTGRPWASVLDLFRGKLCRGCRGRRAAVVLASVLSAAGFRVFFFFFRLLLLNPHCLLHLSYEAALPHVSLHYYTR